MLLECGDSDTDSADQEPAQDTEAILLELPSDANPELSTVKHLMLL